MRERNKNAIDLLNKWAKQDALFSDRLAAAEAVCKAWDDLEDALLEREYDVDAPELLAMQAPMRDAWVAWRNLGREDSDK